MRLARRSSRRRAELSARLRRYISRTCWATVNESMRLDRSARGRRGDGPGWGRVSWMGEGQVELALEILLGDFAILRCHVGTLVAEQFHDGSEADAGSQHFRSIGLSKLVGDAEVMTRGLQGLGSAWVVH
jgi:hypothetical protein